RRPTPPATADRAWPRNPIDQFVLHRLEREGLTPSPEASKEILLRRATLDLTGLPPTLAEMDAFLADTAADAYERAVDRLLKSPHYGERMAWDWLDASRYADTNGYQGDSERTMWPWRDWVVRSFNDDAPYDRFTVEQLAGDLLPNATPDQKLATAFNRNYMINGEGGRIPEENRVEYLFDQTETAGSIWLGLTLTCTRCHDHKFDPITKKEYFQLLAYFDRTVVDGGGGSGQTAPILDFATPAQTKEYNEAAGSFDSLAKEMIELEKKMVAASEVVKDGKAVSTLPSTIRETLRQSAYGRPNQNFDELAKFYEKSNPDYVAKLTEVRQRKQRRDAAQAAIPRVMVMEDAEKPPRETFQLTRGAYDKREDKVEPGTPSVLHPLPSAAPKNRTALAQWIVDPQNPLTARVTVNRFWQNLFGVGLVKTSEDFGLQSEKPSHPELLDWLADEFVRTGWDVKELHRLVVTSSTYRQSSKASKALRDRDPDNRLLARASRHR
ncbi:MAG: DUF1549 and DUF1553 domain-containing protein, partial [Planctomycetia bacterium]